MPHQSPGHGGNNMILSLVFLCVEKDYRFAFYKMTAVKQIEYLSGWKMRNLIRHLNVSSSRSTLNTSSPAEMVKSITYFNLLN